MAKFNVSQNSFSFGELSPTIKGRNDLKEYKSGVEKFINFLSMRSGGGTKRPGFKFIAELPHADADGDNTGVLPFNPNDNTGYYIVITTGAGIPDANSPKIYKVDGTVCTVTLDSSATYTLDFNKTLDPLGWRYTQSSDILFVTHNSGLIEPYIIIRTADTAFTMRAYAKEEYVSPTDGILGTNPRYSHPFLDDNVSATTFAYNAGVITSSVAIFTTADIGRHVKIYDGTKEQYFRITAFTSTTVVSAFGLSDIAPIGATAVWALSAWGGQAGYPTQVTMQNQRLCWMATKGLLPLTASQPNFIWCSATGNLFKMIRDEYAATDFDSSDAFAFAIAGAKPNLIVWCESGTSLKVGTIGEEYIINFAVLEDNSSSYAVVKQQTSHGGSDVITANAGYSTLYSSRTGKEVRQFKYNDENGSHISINLNLLANHLFSGTATNRIKKMVWEEGSNTLWVIGSTGTFENTLYSLTFDTDSNTVSWSEHVLGEENNGVGSALFTIKDLAIISNDNVDEVIGIATTGFATKVNTIVKLSDRFVIGDMVPDDDPSLWEFKARPYYLDHAIRSFEAVATVTHSGFDTLEGRIVSTLVDGVVGGEYTVTGGDITLSATANEVIAGLPYTAKIKTMPIEAGGTLGDSVATVKRIDELNIRFHRSVDCQFGGSDGTPNDTDDIEQIEFNGDGSLYSGVKPVKMRNGYEVEGDYHVTIEQNSPTPLTVLALTYKGQSGN